MADSETQQVTSKTPATQQATDLLLEYCLKAQSRVVSIEDALNFENGLRLMSPEMASVIRLAKPLVLCLAKYVIETHGDEANEMLTVCCEKTIELIQLFNGWCNKK